MFDPEDESYFNTPAGEDLMKKLAISNKIAVYGGLVLATADVVLVTQPKGYVPLIGRMAYVGLPIVGMATVFETTKHFSAQYRKKDDILNWVVGAWGAAGVYGAMHRAVFRTFVMGCAFSVAAALKKYAHDNGASLFLTKELETPACGALRRHDFTIIEERPRGWTTGK